VDVCHFDALELPLGQPISAHLVRQYSRGSDVLHAALLTDYQVPFMITFLVNFAVPFYTLLPRDTKRNSKFIVPVGVLIFLGHFADVYLLVIPGTMFDHNEFGIFEIGLFVGFLGLYINRTLNALSKAPLIAKNHPMLQESKELHY